MFTSTGSCRARLLRFPTAVERDPAIDAWFDSRAGGLGAIARPWFERMRQCGEDVRELLHDGHPTACVGEAAFGYVNAFTAHVNSASSWARREALAALIDAAYSVVKLQC